MTKKNRDKILERFIHFLENDEGYQLFKKERDEIEKFRENHKPDVMKELDEKAKNS